MDGERAIEREREREREIEREREGQREKERGIVLLYNLLTYYFENKALIAFYQRPYRCDKSVPWLTDGVRCEVDHASVEVRTSEP